MKIILNQDVANLGEEGDIVVVKAGYARNFLLPKGMAVLHNKANLAIFASGPKRSRNGKRLSAKKALRFRTSSASLSSRSSLPPVKAAVFSVPLPARWSKMSFPSSDTRLSAKRSRCRPIRSK